jgi:hypothetical protein
VLYRSPIRLSGQFDPAAVFIFSSATAGAIPGGMAFTITRITTPAFMKSSALRAGTPESGLAARRDAYSTSSALWNAALCVPATSTAPMGGRASSSQLSNELDRQPEDVMDKKIILFAAGVLVSVPHPKAPLRGPAMSRTRR